jgi:TolB protein
MSKRSTAKVELSFLGRLLRASLLACALVCGAAVPPAVPGGGAAKAAQGEGGVIAFSAGGEIYVVGAGGGAAEKVVGLEAGGTNRHPAVSPDGTLIAFTSSREGNFSLYLVGVDGWGLRRVTYGPGNDGEPAWSPDGSKLAFVRGSDGTGGGYANMSACAAEIYVVDVPRGLSGGEPVGTEVSLTRGQGGTDPAWSPDGKLIAFSSYRDGNYELYTMDPNGEAVKRLTFTSSAEAEPAWSPDGLSIAYAANLVRVEDGCGWMGIPISSGPGEPGAEAPGIYVMNVGRNRHRKLSAGDGITDPTWSPDGLSIAFVGVLISDLAGDPQLYRAAAATGLRTQLTFDGAPKSSPSWSR